MDSPSLCILASLSKDENPFEIEHYFKLTLDELNIALPDKREAAIEYALAIVYEILEGEKELVNGTREVIDKAINSYDFFSESEQYSYDSIQFEKAYGLFDTFEELSDSDYAWQKDKTNEQLMEELKSDLREELKKWKDRFK